MERFSTPHLVAGAPEPPTDSLGPKCGLKSESQPLPPHQCQNKKPGTACQGAWRLFCLQLGGTNDSGCTRPTQARLLSDREIPLEESDSGLGGGRGEWGGGEGGSQPEHGIKRRKAEGRGGHLEGQRTESQLDPL